MSERLYALLLRLYPRAFRDRYAEEMARVFRDRRRHENAARVWLDVLADAAVSIPRQHWVRQPHPLYPPSAAPFRLLRNNYLPMWLLGSAVGFSTGVLVRGGRTDPLFWLAVVATLPLTVACMRATRRTVHARRLLKSFRADASGSAVTVVYQGEAVTLQRSEVIGLHDYTARGLRIRTANPAHDLWVPAKTSSYSQMKATLSQWMPLEVTPSRTAAIFSTLSRWTPSEGFAIPLRVYLCFAAFQPTGFRSYMLCLSFLFVVIADAGRGVPVHRRMLTFAGIAILLWRWLG